MNYVKTGLSWMGKQYLINFAHNLGMKILRSSPNGLIVFASWHILKFIYQDIMKYFKLKKGNVK
jgi:hypothetical protein